MRTVFLCYESDPHTGLSTIKEVSAGIIFAADYMKADTPNARRIEEWVIDGHVNGSGCINEFYSIADFETDDRIPF